MALWGEGEAVLGRAGEGLKRWGLPPSRPTTGAPVPPSPTCTATASSSEVAGAGKAEGGGTEDAPPLASARCPCGAACGGEGVVVPLPSAGEGLAGLGVRGACVHSMAS